MNDLKPLIETTIEFAPSREIHKFIADHFAKMSDADAEKILAGVAELDWGGRGYTMMWAAAMPLPGEDGVRYNQPEPQQPVELTCVQTSFTLTAPLGALVQISLAAKGLGGKFSPPIAMQFIIRDTAPLVQSPGMWITGVEVCAPNPTKPGEVDPSVAPDSLVPLSIEGQPIGGQEPRS